MAVCGDFNVAPEDRDVWDPAAMVGATHVTAPERAACGLWRTGASSTPSGWCHGEDQLFTWWDYRAGNFHKHMGLRIDLVMLSRPLADHVTYALVDRNARKGKQPSDHAPVLIDIDV